VDIFGAKSQKLLAQAQGLLAQAQEEMAKDIERLKDRQDTAEQRIAALEDKQNAAAERIQQLQESVDSLRDSAIRGEVASGRKSKDVAMQFRLSPARIAQIAPRRRFNNG
jgi:predicted  nucleic acid-binding Zn-ribbon protein